MAMETDVILRTLLYQAKMSVDTQAIIRAIEAMCSKEVISTINEMVREEKERLAKRAEQER